MNSCQLAIGAPSTASTRSPSRSPASAAGFPAITVPNTGSGFGWATPEKKKTPQ